MIGRLIKKSWKESYDEGRVTAIVYINGKVYEDRNHSGAICQYYDETNDENEDYNVAVGYLCTDGNIYLSLDTLRNIDKNDIDDVLLKIKEKYPNNDIVQDSFYNKNDSNNGKKLAELKKTAMDFGDRDFAIAYINGEVFRARTHAACINKYLMSKSVECLNASRRRPDLGEINLLDSADVDELLTHHDQEDLAILRDNITQLGFAHAVDGSNEDSGYSEEDGKHIYVEQNTLYNVDFNTVVNTIKQIYPEYDIHVEETEEKVARLKKSAMDIQDRNCAICYIDGEFIEAYTHSKCIDEYLHEKGKSLNESKFRSTMFDSIDEEFDFDQLNIPDFKKQELKQDIETIKNNISQIVFAHKVCNKNSIYIEQYTLYNIDISTSTGLFKTQYPDYDIYVEETEEKVAKLKKVATDVNNRDCAICYIDGEFLNGYTHGQCIDNYLKKTHDKNLNDSHNRPIEFYPDYDKPENLDLSDLETDDIELIKNNISQIVFAHQLNNGNIFIEKTSLYNIDINSAIKLFKQQYPNFGIYIDETEEKVANNSRLRKISRSDYNDRDPKDGAIVYIDGEILARNSHAVCINEYLEAKFDKSLHDKRCRPIGFDPQFNDDDDDDDEFYRDDSDIEDMNNIKNNIKEMAFAHKNDKNYSISIEEDSLYNMSLEKAANAIKAAYPDYTIYNDLTKEKVARLKRIADENYAPNGIMWNDDMWDTYDEQLVKKQDSGLHKEWNFEEPTDNAEWITQQD